MTGCARFTPCGAHAGLVPAYKSAFRLACPTAAGPRSLVALAATQKRGAAKSSPVSGNTTNAWNVNFNNGNTNNNDVSNTNRVRCVR